MKCKNCAGGGCVVNKNPIENQELDTCPECNGLGVIREEIDKKSQAEGDS